MADLAQTAMTATIAAAVARFHQTAGLQADGIVGDDDAHPSCAELLIEFPHLVAVSTLAAAGFCCGAGSVCRSVRGPGAARTGPASGGSIRMARSVMGFVTDFVTHAGHRGVPWLGVVGRRARRRLSVRAW
jgi:hypothetical protein